MWAEHAGIMRVTAQERMNDFTAGPGGVMTDEVAVVTGDLTLRTTVDSDGEVVRFVRYQQAAGWVSRQRGADPATTGRTEHRHRAGKAPLGTLGAAKLTVRTTGFDEPASGPGCADYADQRGLQSPWR
jgi:hypothetical protein